MKYVITFFITFITVFLVYFLFMIKRKKAILKLNTSLEVRYLVSKYKIDIDKINLKSLAYKIALCNTFIISITFMIILFIKMFILKMLVGFIALFPLILIGYHILGISLKKKEGK